MKRFTPFSFPGARVARWGSPSLRKAPATTLPWFAGGEAPPISPSAAFGGSSPARFPLPAHYTVGTPSLPPRLRSGNPQHASEKEQDHPGGSGGKGSYRRKSRASMTVIHVPTWMPTIHQSRSSIPAIRVVRSSNRLSTAEKRAAMSVRRSSSRLWTSSIRFESSPSFIAMSTLSCRLATVKHARAVLTPTP